VNKAGGPGGERIIYLGICYNTLIQDNIFDILGERDELDKKNNLGFHPLVGDTAVIV
jgi:hypothetical protein